MLLCRYVATNCSTTSPGGHHGQLASKRKVASRLEMRRALRSSPRRRHFLSLMAAEMLTAEQEEAIAAEKRMDPLDRAGLARKRLAVLENYQGEFQARGIMELHIYSSFDREPSLMLLAYTTTPSLLSYPPSA